jgi:hypothetical protein
MDQKPHDQNLDELIRVYQAPTENHIALFLGAGVNRGEWTDSKNYEGKHEACGSWRTLIEKVAGNYQDKDTIHTVFNEHKNDWIKAATRLLDGQDLDLVIEQIDQAIYSDVFTHPEKRIGRDSKHKILEWKVLKKMPTLRAVVAFTAAINDRGKERSMCRNPKVGRVLTTNYDFFFGAAWPRYTSTDWRPRTWKSVSDPLSSGNNAPIIYLHGYLPYAGKGNRNVILLEKQYEQAYRPYQTKTPAKFDVIREIKDAIERFNVIFIGFSFADTHVMNVLSESKSSKRHFAFLGRDEAQSASSLGILPIEVSDWSKLPDMLGEIYCSGIPEDKLDEFHLTRSEYWQTLLNAQGPQTKSKM